MKKQIMKNMGINSFLISALIIFVSACSGVQKAPEKIIKADGPPPAIIPLPDSLSWGENMYLIPEENTICFNQGGETAAQWLQQLLGNTPAGVEIAEGDNCGNWNIIRNDDLLQKLGEEGYTLNISNTGVNIEAATEVGLFYGIQTLRQFFPSEIEQGELRDSGILLRQAFIEDSPEYGWRGTMVDVARSFFGLEYLKKHIDRMAVYKLNRLHLHLTDDQGWRIEIKSKPKLTEVGGDSSVKNGNSGFLTQEEYKELQRYAQARNIMVIPEIDMPGHIYAALRSYPELNCDDQANINPKRATPPEPYREYSVGWSKFCLEDPETYDFVSEVIGELAEITTGPYIHIGGDEIQDPLYKEFVIKADSIVRSLGKTSIGWEEVTQAEVDSSLISQQWRGTVESVVDVKVIHSLCSQFYFDHANVPGQENTNNWCKESGVSMEDAYSFSSDNPNVLGVEAPVWTEFVINEERLDDRFWPRTLAVAEVGWTSETNRSFENFMERLEEHATRLNQMGINYFETPGIEWKKENKQEIANTVFSGFMPKSID